MVNRLLNSWATPPAISRNARISQDVRRAHGPALTHGAPRDSEAGWDHRRSLGEAGPDVAGESKRHEVLSLRLQAVKHRAAGPEQRPDAVHDPLAHLRSVQRPREQLPQLGEALGRPPPPLSLLEQLRVVERDGRLVAEGLQQGDFSCRKRPLGLVHHPAHTENGLGHPKGHGENFLNLGGLDPTTEVVSRDCTHPEGISYHRLSFGDGPARDPHARRYAMARLEGTP